ncbi:MAG: NAD-dependent epimerase/dehydratase family protein [Acidimicrobiia bacterium]
MPEGLAAGARVVVTGGHGFIGRYVVAALAADGFSTVAVAHPKGDPVDVPHESAVVDLTDAPAVDALLEGAEAVVHLAARAGGVQFQAERAAEVFRSNREITDTVVSGARRAGVSRVFLASSTVVYRSAPEPLTEDHPLLSLGDNPSPYAWSKITDEVVASWVDDVEVVVGRFGNVYGPGAPFDAQRSTVVHALIDRAARLEAGEPLTVWGDGSAVRSFVFVEDVARAVSLILTAGAAGTAYNVDSGEAVAIRDLAAAVVAAVAPEARIVFDAAKPSGPSSRVASIDRLQDLGFQPRTSLSDGVARTVSAYRSGG